MAKAIKVEGLSKAYQLGDFGTGTISRDIERFIARVRGKEDPFLRIGEVNDRTIKGESDIVWSLKDMDFEIEQGDAVGIIGRNGAGKSTLLKILSRITSPTIGTVKVKGRVASLLEVGTGFHPELIGRENIYLNGAILGMRKKEIKRKFDEIVDFSGVERYIDTPVKRYSSGMYVRLAFAVAAHLESEILIVDEVLAVGDAEFQKKCLGKMGDVSKGEGRTILFVSHNMGAIQKLCDLSILLSSGQLLMKDRTNSVVEAYLLKDGVARQFNQPAHLQHKRAFIQYAEISNDYNNIDVVINIAIFCNEDNIDDVAIDIRLKTHMLDNIGFASIGTFEEGNRLSLKKGDNQFTFKLLTDKLAVGNYSISIDVTIPNKEYLDRQEDCLIFEIEPVNNQSGKLDLKWNYGALQIPAQLITD